MSFTIATSVDEALELMAAGARPIAGGTDLVVGARHGKAPLPADLVAIDRLTELAAISATGDHISVGALVSHARLMSDTTVVDALPGLADASALVGSPSTRHVGTLGGNLMNASPAMDTGAPLLASGGEVVLKSTRGERRVALADLWTGPGSTTAADDELLTEVVVPRVAASSTAYVRLEYRRAMEIAVVGAGARVVLADDGSVASVDVALTAVAPTIIRVDGLDDVSGWTVAEAVDAARDAAAQQAMPISDLRASDRYRRHSVGVMAARAVDAAARRAGGETIAIPLNRAEGIGAAS